MGRLRWKLGAIRMVAQWQQVEIPKKQSSISAKTRFWVGKYGLISCDPSLTFLPSNVESVPPSLDCGVTRNKEGGSCSCIEGRRQSTSIWSCLSTCTINWFPIVERRTQDAQRWFNVILAIPHHWSTPRDMDSQGEKWALRVTSRIQNWLKIFE